MKTSTLTTIAMLLGFAPLALAAENPDIAQKAKDKAACCAESKDCCKPCLPKCDEKDKSIRTGDRYWVDMETITVEAENGDPIAQYTVAYLVDEGKGTEKDPEKAKDMYTKALPGLEKAAAEGHAGACCALAHMYWEGKGVPKDEAKAKEYMRMCKKAMKAKHHKSCPCPPTPQPAAPTTDTPAPAPENT
ncbi:MAG: sel1 repeat family protein [Akkermansia sp.]|nr:sel1 repeat family protein [Akkermansia sp.]